MRYVPFDELRKKAREHCEQLSVADDGVLIIRIRLIFS